MQPWGLHTIVRLVFSLLFSSCLILLQSAKCSFSSLMPSPILWLLPLLPFPAVCVPLPPLFVFEAAAAPPSWPHAQVACVLFPPLFPASSSPFPVDCESDDVLVLAALV